MANSNQKGGRKGGTRYPKLTLDKAVEYAKRLVSKTHTAAQPAAVIKPGVFDSNTWLGDLRLSATKQYGFVAGDSKGYSATELAKKINAATQDELNAHLKVACLKPKIYSDLHNTFHDEVVSSGKLKQQALTLGVHPDNGEECVETFIESLVFAGLAVKTDSDKIQIYSSNQLTELLDDPENEEEEDSFENEENEQRDSMEPEDSKEQANFNQQTKKQGASNINVNIDIDPSMDPEKLEKLLKLLKGYGAI